jgi:hypothetical protein
MKVAPLKQPVKRAGESIMSIICGTFALVLGSAAIVLLLSYLVGHPIGPARFYVTEQIQVRDSSRQAQAVPVPYKYFLPSLPLLAILIAGACSSGLGIHVTRRRWPNRKAITSSIGMIVCAVGLCLAWCLVVWAAMLT